VAQPAIQTSFASGEWAPKLRSRVDVQKYHSGAALLRNFFVDYSGGGASTRQGTRFINQCKSSGSRLISFQPSSTISYVLEFGQNYIRFYSNGAPILETAVTGVTAATIGGIVTIPNTYAVGDWVYALGFVGLTGINGNYFLVSAASAGSVTLQTLTSAAVAFTGVWTSGGQLQRVYTITTPYAATDLFPNPSTGNPGLKFVQDVTSFIICHPSYSPAVLTIVAANNWTFVNITFGPTVNAPTNVTSTSNLTASNWSYGYLVTSVDANGQESGPSNPTVLSSLAYLGSVAATNTVSWTAAPGAVSYNVYKTSPVYNTTIPSGSQYGFIGNTTGTKFTDTYPGIDADFSQTPPIPQNPIIGGNVLTIALGTNANYTTVPLVTIAAPPTGGYQATAYASLQANAISSISHAAFDDDVQTVSGVTPVGVLITFSNGVVCRVSSAILSGLGGFYEITGLTINVRGSVTSGNVPANPLVPVSAYPSGIIASFGAGFGPNLTWNIGSLILIQGGYGYPAAPGVTFSSGAATATTTVSPISGGGSPSNPGIVSFFQERMVLAAATSAIQSYNMSQPVSFFNFDVSNPSEDDDAISGTIISEELNDIRSLTPVPTGLIALTGKGSWLINGGGGLSVNNPITPSNQTASSQAFNGANDLRPLKINLDILYGTNKGNYVRDLAYNIYAAIYTGSDISVLSNHLFFGYYMLDWAWAEEPFKTLWAVRNDGTLLSLGYVKEQDLIGWAHHDTNGQFTSVCSVIENVNGNIVDAVYTIVQRLVNGNLVSYVERMADRYFPYGYEDSWSVDCALQTAPQVSPVGTLTIAGNASVVGNAVTLTDTVDAPFTNSMVGWVVRAGGGIYTITGYTSTSVVSATVKRVPSVINPYTNVPFPITGGYTIWQPVTTVSGLTQLIGQTVTGVADGAVVPPTVVSATGSVNLASASKITLGLAFLPQLQSLPLDLGEPTIQGKRKKITGVTLRVADTLGLQIGTSFANAVTMKDFILGNIGTQSNQQVTDLVDGDGRTIIDQAWQEAGNYCIQQNLPYPATILGAMPEVTVGDTQR
jgi:hypothetical protein